VVRGDRRRLVVRGARRQLVGGETGLESGQNIVASVERAKHCLIAFKTHFTMVAPQLMIGSIEVDGEQDAI
jgi:hypothetical protein